MCGGPKTVTSTSSTAPPAYMVPHIKSAASAAANSFNTLNGGGYNASQPINQQLGLSGFDGAMANLVQGSSQFRDLGQSVKTGAVDLGNYGDFGGGNITGGMVGQGASPAQRTGAGLDALFNRGAQGSPVMGAANNLTQQTLQGDYLGPDTNPYLQQTFNRAADLTRGRLDSEFAGAGRNLGASRAARSDELQTLASNIYGQNYQAERDRMGQAVGQAQGLQNADFQNIQAQIDAGSFPLDQYINRLGGLIPGAGGVTQSSQPVFRTGLF